MTKDYLPKFKKIQTVQSYDTKDELSLDNYLC